jgi:hypothetical protein
MQPGFYYGFEKIIFLLKMTAADQDLIPSAGITIKKLRENTG